MKITDRATIDPAFRVALKANSGEAISNAFGDELSDADLDTVSAAGYNWYLCGPGGST